MNRSGRTHLSHALRHRATKKKEDGDFNIGHFFLSQDSPLVSIVWALSPLFSSHPYLEGCF